jgi:putative glutamine amidotransferase
MTSRRDRTGALTRYCGQPYLDAVAAGGGVPVLLPPTDSTTAVDAALRACDGFLLIGGGDAGPQQYAQLSPGDRRTLSGVDERLDAFELALVRRALAADRPVLGICRGMQMVALAAGGQLIPDIRRRQPHALNHCRERVGAAPHPIAWVPGTRLARLLGVEVDVVNSTHHQAVDTLPRGWVVAARAPDGILEAIEKPRATFACGVQFHPERMLDWQPAVRKLFTALVEVAAAGR